MAERIEIDIVAKTENASRNIANLGNKMRELGERFTAIGTRISAAFTIPLGIAFGAALRQSTALQNSIKPIQDIFNKLAVQLGNQLVPVFIQLTPSIQKLGVALSEMITAIAPMLPTMVDAFKSLVTSLTGVVQGFNALPKDQQKQWIETIAVLAASGPGLIIAGQGLATIGSALGVISATIQGLAKFMGVVKVLSSFLALVITAGAGLAAIPSLAGLAVGQKLGVTQYALKAAGVQGYENYSPTNTTVPGIGQTVINYINNGVDTSNPLAKAAINPFIDARNRQTGGR